MVANRRVLISGAGIAGLTLAYWLREAGFEPTIVEKRPDLSDEGYMIDFYGSGYDVAEKMGLLDALDERHYPISKLTFVDADGKRRAALSVERLRKLLKYRHFNFMRGDLAAVLYDAVRDTVPIKFGTTIADMAGEPDALSVTLSDGTRGRWHMLFGADGIHSHVRRLLWGEERQFTRLLGFAVACGIIDNILETQDAFLSHLEPGRQASVYAIRGNRLATFFAFDFDRIDIQGREAQLAAVRTVFGGDGWIVPELLDAMNHTESLYFDPVAQISLTPWYKGRVALVGDACQCLTLLAGQGASMAMAGAYILARLLRETEGDYAVAFPAYQRALKPEIDRRQERARGLAGSFVPRSRFAIRLNYLYYKLMFLPGLRGIFRRAVGARSIVH